MAVSTDCNPGTSPTTHLPLMLNMACTLFRLTPAEALLGRHAARGPGARPCKRRTATIEPGKVADLCLWDLDQPAALAYEIATGALRARFKNGVQHPLQ